VKRILLFSRRQEADQKIVAIRPVVDEAVKLMRFTLPKNIHVRTVYAPDLPTISGDVSQLSQVIMNLATNAAHAMIDGGDLTVEVESVDVPANLAATDLKEGRYVRVIVRDTGTGMSRDTLERMFEPFFTTKGGGGTGLGLSVVHGIVHDHRGAIRAESDPGRGTTIRIYFPAVEGKVSNVSSAPRPELKGRGEKIMYVDDEEMLVPVMTRSLRVLGYRGVGYTDPLLALREFTANPSSWAAVVTDLAMPVMSGLDLVREMRAVRPDIRVALVSGNVDDHSLVEDAGITTHLEKPYSIEELGIALHELLSSEEVLR